MRREGEDQRVSGFLRALDGVSEVTNGAAASKVASPDTAAADGDVRKPVRRASLIERITRAEKPVA